MSSEHTYGYSDVDYEKRLFQKVPRLKEDLGDVLDVTEMNQREIDGLRRIIQYICLKVGLDWEDVIRSAIFEMDKDVGDVEVAH